MAIERFFTTTISVTRLTWSNDSSSEISKEDFLGHIQQASPEMAQYIGESLGRAFSVWCNKSVDIEIGDSLSIDSGDYAGDYTVKNVQINATGDNQHLELICIKPQD